MRRFGWSAGFALLGYAAWRWAAGLGFPDGYLSPADRAAQGMVGLYSAVCGLCAVGAPFDRARRIAITTWGLSTVVCAGLVGWAYRALDTGGGG